MSTRVRKETRAAVPGRLPEGALGVIGWAGGAFLGAVLVFGGVVKALDPQAFVKQIEIEGLDFLLPAVVVTAIALALEMGLGSALILGLRRMWVLGPSALLVAFFLFLTGRAYYRDLRGIATEDEAGCGCFGHLVERPPAAAFWPDLARMVPARAPPPASGSDPARGRGARGSRAAGGAAAPSVMTRASSSGSLA